MGRMTGPDSMTHSDYSCDAHVDTNAKMVVEVLRYYRRK